MGYFKHPQAIVETKQVGDGTEIWAFAHVLADARIGRDCRICDHTFIENDVEIGDRVTIKCGVQLWDGVTVEDDVFIGPNATFTNDPFPRSKHRPAEFARTVVQAGSSIGANATILPGIVIGAGSMVGAGSVVTHNVPSRTKVIGNPAHIVGYVGEEEESPPPSVVVPAAPADGTTSALVELPLVEDLRGLLSFGEIGRQVPFEVKRYFLVFGVSTARIRGEHSHKKLHQFLVCVHGSLSVAIDDGATRKEYLLDSPAKGLHLPPMVWGVFYGFSPDAVLLVLASDFYDPDDYIRDYNAFLELRRTHDHS